MRHFAAVKLDANGSVEEVVGYWDNEWEAKQWAARNWDTYTVVPYWRI
jgi:hypothetical protein